jgi:tRNA pseudouridine38-40 synthase
MHDSFKSLSEDSRGVEEETTPLLDQTPRADSIASDAEPQKPEETRTLRGIRLTVAYDGSRYQGWQSQTNLRTVQGEVQRIARQVVGEDVNLHASGRTDAGVHALGQVVSFQTHCTHSPEIWLKAFSGHLPFDISVIGVEETPPEFHARKYAIRKRYRYLLYDGQISEVLAMNYMWQTRRTLNFAKMKEASKLILGKHDFASFESGGSRRRSTVRTVYEVKLWRPALDDGSNSESNNKQWTLPPLINPQHLIVLEVEADGFLYNMVRTIVGSLVQIGCGREPVEWIEKVFAARDRRAAGKTAPAQGLYLMSVIYPDPIVYGFPKHSS